MPVSGPLSTAGLSRVRLVLPRPVVASIVVVRLHRPRDSSTLGLSQLKLLGTTTFREASRSGNEASVTDHTPHRARYCQQPYRHVPNHISIFFNPVESVITNATFVYCHYIMFELFELWLQYVVAEADPPMHVSCGGWPKCGCGGRGQCSRSDGGMCHPLTDPSWTPTPCFHRFSTSGGHNTCPGCLVTSAATHTHHDTPHTSSPQAACW